MLKDQKVQVRIDSDNKTAPYIIPSVNHMEKDGVVESVSIVIDPSDEDKIETIIKKTAKRIGVPKKRITIAEKPVHSKEHQEIHIQLSIDLHDFKLGLLVNFNVDLIKNGIVRIVNNL